MRVPAWRAKAVAETTIHTSPALTREAAGFVDSQVAAVAGRVGAAQLDRLVAETIKRYDIADALDLDRAVAHRAATQKALGSQLPLAARRAKALGDLARTQTALDLAFQDGATQQADADAADQPNLPAAREVVIHAHFDAATVGEQTVFGPTGRMENGQRLILLEQVRSWCADSRTKVTIKPVIDLNAQLTAQGYAIPDRIREQIILRDRTCVCRFHHRLKTHSPWTYAMTATEPSDPPGVPRPPRR